jgi:hypothetical protein|uniref:Uncharacterized protein n=2 Tax=Oryza TaxID=4527 RepID=A0A0E0HFI9_ORYNI
MEAMESRAEDQGVKRREPCKKRIGRTAGAGSEAGNGSRHQASCSPPPAPSSSFPRRCARLVKEQRARLYIVRRCITMLACWRDVDYL